MTIYPDQDLIDTALIEDIIYDEDLKADLDHLDDDDDDDFLNTGSKAKLSLKALLKKGPRIFVDCALDTEYKESDFITIQVSYEGHFITQEATKVDFSFKAVIVNEKFAHFLTDPVKKEFINKTNALLIIVNDIDYRHKSCIVDLLLGGLTKTYGLKYDIETKRSIPLVLNIFFYYSLKDINFAFGPEFMRLQYLNNTSKLLQY